jgi:YidC/Oxa1 family membrane protein insertase
MLTNMTDFFRFTLYGVLIAILLMLFQAWNKDHPQPVVTNTATTTSETVSNNYIPQVTNSNVAKASTTGLATQTAPITTNTGSIIQVSTDVLNLNIDTLGGNIVQVSLPKYPAELHSKDPVVLLNNSPDTRYIAQSGLLSANGPDTSKGQAVYTADQTSYTMSPDQNELQVKLHWQNQAGLTFTKIFTFTRGKYEVDVTYQIENKSQQAWDGNLYLQLMRKNTPPVSKNGLVSLATYFGAAISTPDKPFEKIPFKDMLNKSLNMTVTGGWAAMIQHYFVSAWVPDKNSMSQYFSRVTNDGLYTIGMLGPKVSVNPGETLSTQAKFYAGPAVVDKLEKVAPGLQLTIDYGWFWFISAPILWVMQKIYSVVGNWGWSIVLVTVLIKLMFFHLSAKSYRSMSAMKKLQPKINSLKERFGEDKQKFTQATLELYKKEKVNPMSGCLPILIQIPVFIALYWVLIESVELRQAPFILWIQDLSTKDPFYVLPVLMGISMFLQQRLNPPPPDPMQAKVMAFMPVMFTILFVNFPAGLMLYWFVNNTLSFTQQWYIMRSMDKAEKSKKK